jgi:hypothetical protein
MSKKMHSTEQHNLVWWLQYVGDMLMFSVHELEKLDFLDYHRHPILYEDRDRGPLSFPRYDVYRRTDGSLGHRIHGKSTNTLTSNSMSSSTTIWQAIKLYVAPW